jgi:hypothetical protein
VESGFLEAQTMRLVESVRRHAGAWARSKMYAVTPRPGPPLARATRRHFERHDVRYIDARLPGALDWFRFRNKPKALARAEEDADTEVMCWLDSDLLFLGEPEGLEMDGVDFVACASDKEMGTSGPSDPYEPFWAAMCEALGFALDELPWITTEMERTRIRLYWNSGFFAYRRGTGFAEEYLRQTDALLASRVVTDAPHFALGIDEMAALGFAMVKLGLAYRSLPYTHNYPWGSRTPREWYADETLRKVRILHYHDAMWPPMWPDFIARVRAAHPDVAEWLAPLGPMKNEAPLLHRGLARGLRALRDTQERRHWAACRTVLASKAAPVEARAPRAVASR